MPHNFRFVLALLVAVYFGWGFPRVTPAADTQLQPKSVEKIWDRGPHNAFTDLLLHQGRLYCTFREGSGHVPGDNGTDGVIRVLVCENLEDPSPENWKSLLLLKEEEIDLRDPKLSVTPAGQIMVLIGGTDYDGRIRRGMAPRVTFLDPTSGQATPIQPVRLPPQIATANDWLWRVTWHKNTGYGVVYQPSEKPDKRGLHLVKTSDGVEYELVYSFNKLQSPQEDVPGSPNETTVRVLSNGEMALMIRREKGDTRGWIATAPAPFQEWTFDSLNVRLGGPNFVELPDHRWLVGTRKYAGGARTMLGLIDADRNFHELHVLPSGGDTSYPGFVIHGDRVWMSYYSSHSGQTAIYLAEYSLAEILQAGR